MTDRFFDGTHVNGGAVQQDLTSDIAAIATAKKTHGQLGSSGSHQSGNAEDFTAPNMKIDALDKFPVSVLFVKDRPVLDLENGLSDIDVYKRQA